MGFALADVRELLLLEDGLDCCTAQKLARAKLEQVERQIADLRRMRARLADTVAAYADGVRARCPLIDALLE